MKIELTACVLGLCTLSSGCNLAALATRNLLYETTLCCKELREGVHHRRADPAEPEGLPQATPNARAGNPGEGSRKEGPVPPAGMAEMPDPQQERGPSGVNVGRPPILTSYFQ